MGKAIDSPVNGSWPLLKQFGTFVAWLSGSLAGITAALYALGYVATLGANQVLGIGSDFASRAPGFYIARGGSLILRTVLISIWPVLALVVIAAAVRWLCRRTRLAERRSLDSARRLADSVAAPLVAMAMVALALAGIVYVLQPALNVDGLLFATKIPQKICLEAHGLRRAILTQDHARLDQWFDLLALGAGVVAGMGIIALPHLTRPKQNMCLAIAGVAAFLALITIPLAYGTLVVEAAPPEVRIEPVREGGTESARLLSRSEGGVLLWLQKERRVKWVSAQGINSLTVMGPGEAIKTLHCPDSGTTLEKRN